MSSNDPILGNVAHFTVIDYTLLIIILSLSIGIGVYFAFFSKKLKTADDYLVGGHKMKPLPIAISLVARCVFFRLSSPKYKIDHLKRMKKNRTMKKHKFTLNIVQPIVSTVDCSHSGRNLLIRMAVFAGDSNSRRYHHHCQLPIFASVLSKQHR